MEKIGDRLKQLIAAKTDDRLRYVQLESATGISADLWKNFWFGRKKADAEMIEAASKTWPENAFWLATGITDTQFGHVATIPDATYPELNPRQSMPASSEYFRASVRARAAAFECIDALNANAQDGRLVSLKDVPRIALSAWPLGKDIPELTNELQDRMYELQDRKSARKPEVGLDAELEAIVDAIKHNYEEKAVVSQINAYKKRQSERLFK
ncbi:hypothetical protein [Burkholderia gladioli]|uniref:hypothetical protein n=1 Tax=Burkholderia gladioli TaxID=28095 RepID=UPI00163E838F|nr:hypothetical protein [Burkholderia gladioli]